jgi:hypothetical protein
VGNRVSEMSGVSGICQQSLPLDSSLPLFRIFLARWHDLLQCGQMQGFN